MKKRFRESTADVGGFDGYDEPDGGNSRPALEDEEPLADQEAPPPSTIMSRLMAKSQKVEEDEGERQGFLFASESHAWLRQTMTLWRR